MDSRSGLSEVPEQNFFLVAFLVVQRRDLLGTTTKIPRLSTGTTRKLKPRRSQYTVSNISDVFADEEAIKGHAGLSVSGMKLRSEKNFDGDQGRSSETGQASETLTDPFEEGEQTLIRPDYHHHADLEEPGKDFERDEVESMEGGLRAFRGRTARRSIFQGNVQIRDQE